MLRNVAEKLRELGRGAVRVGLRKVDLVRDGDDLELVVEREVGVRERLRLDALRGVDEQERALAGLKRARDLVREVDVPGGVDQVQLVASPEDAHRLRLDRDPALAFELHRVEDLLAHLPLGDRVGQLEDAIGERRLAMVDVRDDREVADPFLLHSPSSIGQLDRSAGATRWSPRAGHATVATCRAREFRAARAPRAYTSVAAPRPPATETSWPRSSAPEGVVEPVPGEEGCDRGRDGGDPDAEDDSDRPQDVLEPEVAAHHHEEGRRRRRCSRSRSRGGYPRSRPGRGWRRARRSARPRRARPRSGSSSSERRRSCG